MEKKPAKKSPSLKAVWPQLRELIIPRRGLLVLGLILMVINRVSGLVLPSSTKYLIDNVLGGKQYDMLLPLVLGVVGATLIQGATSFSLTQLLSKAGQRLIAGLRRKGKGHTRLL